MVTLSTYRVEWHGVAPRRFFVSAVDEPPSCKAARYAPTQFASQNRRNPPRPDVKNALTLLDVGTVCPTAANHCGQASSATPASRHSSPSARSDADPKTISLTVR